MPGARVWQDRTAVSSTPASEATAEPGKARDPEPIPYELRIGVTGHCEIEDAAKLAAAVKDVVNRNILEVLEGAAAHPRGKYGAQPPPLDWLFRTLTWLLAPLTRVLFSAARLAGAPFAALTRAFGRERPRRIHWPIVLHGPVDPAPERRTPLDLTVVTSLAPGADQIVANAVCACVARPHLRNRILEAVLPLPPEVYEENFELERDRAAFRELLKRDRGVHQTHPEPTVIYPDFPRDHPVERWEAFRDAGREVVESSEILLAVWDPERDASPGGTKETIEYALNRGRVVLWLDPKDLDRARAGSRPCPARRVRTPGVRRGPRPGKC